MLLHCYIQKLEETVTQIYCIKGEIRYVLATHLIHLFKYSEWIPFEDFVKSDPASIICEETAHSLLASCVKSSGKSPCIVIFHLWGNCEINMVPRRVCDLKWKREGQYSLIHVMWNQYAQHPVISHCVCGKSREN